MSDQKITLNHPAIQGDIQRARRVIEARTQQRFLRRTLPGLGAIIAILAIGYLSGHAVAMQQAKSADWTVPDCKVYAHTSTPDLPAFTRTDVCANVKGDGIVELSYTDGSTATVAVNR